MQPSTILARSTRYLVYINVHGLAGLCGMLAGDAPLLVAAAATVSRCLTEVISNNPNLAPGDNVAMRQSFVPRTMCYRGGTITQSHRTWYVAHQFTANSATLQPYSNTRLTKRVQSMFSWIL